MWLCRKRQTQSSIWVLSKRRSHKWKGQHNNSGHNWASQTRWSCDVLIFADTHCFLLVLMLVQSVSGHHRWSSCVAVNRRLLIKIDMKSRLSTRLSILAETCGPHSSCDGRPPLAAWRTALTSCMHKNQLGNHTEMTSRSSFSEASGICQ